LSVQELLQKAVLEDVNLVDVERAPEFDGVVADITYFDRRLRRNLTLDAERPLLHIGRAQVRIEGDQTTGGLCLREVGGVAEGRVEGRSLYRHAARADHARRVVVGRRQGEAGVGAERTARDTQAVAQVADRVTAADRTLAFPGAEKPFERPPLEARRPRQPEEGREVVPVVLVKRASFVFTSQIEQRRR